MSCRRPERTAALAVLTALLLAAVPASATQPEEPRDLRVRKSTRGRLRLSWQPPEIPVESYTVRSCSLASLANGGFGYCVVEGLTGTAYEDGVPANRWFLVTAVSGGVEQTLGTGWDGRVETPRPAQPCSVPPDDGEFELVLSLEGTAPVAGIGVTVTFPLGSAEWVAGACTGIAAGLPLQSGSSDFGTAWQACGTVGATVEPPGEFARIRFRWPGCRASPDVFRIERCDVVDEVGNPLPGLGCSLRVE